MPLFIACYASHAKEWNYNFSIHFVLAQIVSFINVNQVIHVKWNSVVGKQSAYSIIFVLFFFRHVMHKCNMFVVRHFPLPPCARSRLRLLLYLFQFFFFSSSTHAHSLMHTEHTRIECGMAIFTCCRFALATTTNSNHQIVM